MRSLSVLLPGDSAVFNCPAGTGIRAQRTQQNQGVCRIPAVESATVSGCGLLSNCIGTVAMEVPGYSRGGDEDVSVQGNFVGPKCFETVGMTLRSGHGIDERDKTDSRMIVVVNRRFETRYFGPDRGLDRELTVEGRKYPVVGAVNNARVNDIHQAPQPRIYFPIL